MVTAQENGGSSGSNPVRVGLKTSAGELQKLLARSGAKHNVGGAEKLDLLMWLADQVRGSIEEKRRMQLTIEELMATLEREGMAPPAGPADAKSAISGLLALRRREIARLGYDADSAKDCQANDDCFELALANMPAQQVNDCFEVVLFDPMTKQSQPGETNHSSPSRALAVQGATGASSSLPGAVVEPPRSPAQAPQAAPDPGSDENRALRSDLAAVVVVV
ncbi:unnamed protein product, partial [Polarella glacialis]